MDFHKAKIGDPDDDGDIDTPDNPYTWKAPGIDAFLQWEGMNDSALRFFMTGGSFLNPLVLAVFTKVFIGNFVNAKVGRYIRRLYEF